MTDRRVRWLVAVLLAIGLLGHLLAARALGGSRIAYVHHALGVLLIAAVTGAVIAGLGGLLWRGRPRLTALVIAVVQAVLGLWIWAMTARGIR